MFKRKKQKSRNKKPNVRFRKTLIINFFVTLFAIPLVFFFTKNILLSIISGFVIFVLLFMYFYFREKLIKSEEIKKMESAFPDFLQLMSSNLRAGMTIDRALLLSSRKEFHPLDKEILKLGKNIVTGEKIESALKAMEERIESEKITKTVSLINSGIKSGGNLAVLLEETARNLKERNFVEKKAASNTLMYVIFIFFATGVGAPILFGLSSFLVEVLTSILSTIPEVQGNVDLPFSLTGISVSSTFIIYFSVIFISSIDILGSLILGLINKGEEKAGIKYIIPLLLVGLTIFFLIRVILNVYFADFFI